MFSLIDIGRDLKDIGQHYLRSISEAGLGIVTSSLQTITLVEVQALVQRKATEEAIKERNEDPKYRKLKEELKFNEMLEATGKYKPKVSVKELIARNRELFSQQPY